MADTGEADGRDGAGPTAADLDAVAAHLYALRPDEFVPARDEAVSRAREAGDRDAARAVGRLRRPTRAAWLANLLAQQRGEELDGLFALAGDLADAQRTLDGTSLRALSSQRHRLVAAMSREAGRLARGSGEAVTEPLLRELQGILEAALADPAVATEVRSGRLTRTVSYSGFGPPADADAVPQPARRVPTDPPTAPSAPDQQAERRARERAERERALAAAERDEAAAQERRAAADAHRAAADTEHDRVRARVAELASALGGAQQRERDAAATAREAATTAREAAREAAAAVAVTARARAHLAEPESDPGAGRPGG